MTRTLAIESCGPGVTVQDEGRPGFLDQGLSRGGAADFLALREGAALLGQPPDRSAIEMAGFGGKFRAEGGDIRIALTGAPMRATIDGAPVPWNAGILLPAGGTLSIGSAQTGVYGYLHAGGGFGGESRLGSRSAHLAAGLGAGLAAGDRIPVEPDAGGPTGAALDVEDRFSGGTARLVASMQTENFEESEIARFEATCFARDVRGNRMGARLSFDGPPFAAKGGLSVLSEVIAPGDVQMTGEGAPFVLLAECQTTGGYPRIGTVLPQDLPLVAQAAPGTPIRFRFVDIGEASEDWRRRKPEIEALPSRVRALVRDPRDIPDLLSYQLVGGVFDAGDRNETDAN